jgi:hypothetical protein
MWRNILFAGPYAAYRMRYRWDDGSSTHEEKKKGSKKKKKTKQ